MAQDAGQVDPSVRRENRSDHLVEEAAERMEGHDRHVVRETDPIGHVAHTERAGVIDQIPGHVCAQQLHIALDRPVAVMQKRRVVERIPFRIGNLNAARPLDQGRALDERRHGVHRARVNAETVVRLVDLHIIRNPVVVRISAAVEAEAGRRQRGAERAVRRRLAVVVPVINIHDRTHDARAGAGAYGAPVVLVRVGFVARTVDVRMIRRTIAVLAEEFLRIQQAVNVRIAVESVRAYEALRIQVVFRLPAVRQTVVVGIGTPRIRPLLTLQRR